MKTGEKNILSKLRGYKIEGNIVELLNLIFSNALIPTTIDDVLSVMSNNNLNYIRIGYGNTLAEAYKDAAANGGGCKLVHIYFSPGKVWCIDLYNFINGLGDSVIFGYTVDDKIGRGVKLVMIIN